MDKWTRKWLIDGSKGKTWTVAEDREGNYACSCPVWKFRRLQCHHIEAVKKGASKLLFALIGKAELVRGHTLSYDPDTNTLHIPYITERTPDLPSIAKKMLEHGFTMEEFREQYGLGDEWTATYLFRLLG